MGWQQQQLDHMQIINTVSVSSNIILTTVEEELQTIGAQISNNQAFKF